MELLENEISIKNYSGIGIVITNFRIIQSIGSWKEYLTKSILLKDICQCDYYKKRYFSYLVYGLFVIFGLLIGSDIFENEIKLMSNTSIILFYSTLTISAVYALIVFLIKQISVIKIYSANGFIEINVKFVSIDFIEDFINEIERNKIKMMCTKLYTK